MKFWNGLPTRQKILAVVFVLTLVFAGIQFYPSEDSASVTGAAVNRPSGFQPPGPVVPSQAPPQQPPLAALRDPFSVPQGYAAPVNGQSIPPAASPSYYSASPAPNFGTSGTFSGASSSFSGGATASPVLSLTGVVGSGSSKSIIIRYGSDSRSYRMHDQVGPYEIVAIGERSVTLAGAAGHKVLQLGE